MRATLLIALLGVAVAPADRAAPSGQVPAPQASLPVGWAPLPSHSDEFECGALDESKWEVDVAPWGLWSWRRENVSVAHGRLRLRMAAEHHVRGQQSLHYTAGIVRSRAPPLRYAYIEARIRAAPRWPGVASAFWLFRNTPTYWTEIDVVEMMQRRNARNVIDFSHYVLRGDVSEPLPVRRKSYREVGWDPAAGFHVFAVLWTFDGIAYYVDGQPMGRHRNDYWHHPMDLVLSLGLRAPLDTHPSSRGFPTTMEVDYVRAWGPAAPNGRPARAQTGCRLD